MLARFPDADLVEVSSHRNLPGLYGNEGNVADWVRIKQTVLVLGVRRQLTDLIGERLPTCRVRYAF